MNIYKAWWNSKEIEIQAENTYQAQQLARAEFQRNAGRKIVKGYQIAIGLVAVEGKQVTHLPLM